MKHVRALVGLVGILVLALVVSQACSAGGGSSGSESSGTPNGSGGAGGLMISGTGGNINLGGNMNTGGGDNCEEIIAEADEGVLPADVIFVVDNSGSMNAEAQATQQAIADFASIIINAMIDVHVILISADNTDDAGVCAPPPLGSGSCPNDENLPIFRHVNVGVGSSDGLQKILDTYPMWSAQLRANATKTIGIITDDDSALGATDFTTQLIALDPTFQGFKFDAIVAFEDSSTNETNCELFSGGNCAAFPCCGPNDDPIPPCAYIPADVGAVYQQLVSQTNGVIEDICIQQFSQVFQDMATAVVQGSQIPCIYDIPDPGGNNEIDFGKVNVEYRQDANATPQDIFFVQSEGDCDASGGWYYDDPQNPTQILLCEATCTAVQQSTDGSVSVLFGCATKIK